MTRANTCATCRFREPDPRPEYATAGLCHRFPPTILVWTAENYSGPQWEQLWPWVADNEWCGEWQAC